MEIPGIVRDPLYLFSALVGWLHRRPRRGEVRRILIYKLDHIGDLLMATPALRAIRRHYPEAEITLVIGEWNLPIIEGNPNIDRTIVFNSPRYTRAPYTPGRHGDLRRELRSSGDRPDLVIGLRDDWSTLSWSLFSPAQRLERGSSHLREWLDRRRSGQPQFHELDRIWGLLRPAGIEPDNDLRLELVLRDDEREDALAFMRQEGIEPGFIAIQAGATSPLREWDISRFAEVAREVASSGRIVLVGAPFERERSRALYEMIADLEPIDITGRRSLRQLAALLEQAGLYLGSDGGAMHIAAAAGAPTMALFGPGPYHVFYPVGPSVAAVSHHFPCAPCAQTVCIRPDDNCMMAITVEEVVAGIGELRRVGEGRSPL